MVLELRERALVPAAGRSLPPGFPRRREERPVVERHDRHRRPFQGSRRIAAGGRQKGEHRRPTRVGARERRLVAGELLRLLASIYLVLDTEHDRPVGGRNLHHDVDVHPLPVHREPLPHLVRSNPHRILACLCEIREGDRRGSNPRPSEPQSEMGSPRASLGVLVGS